MILVEVFTVYTQDSSTAFGEAVHRVPAATAEQNVDIPAPRGAPQRFSSKSSSCSWFFRFAGYVKSRVFFNTFPRRKKCEDSAHPGVGTGRGPQLMASVSLAGGVAGWLRH